MTHAITRQCVGEAYVKGSKSSHGSPRAEIQSHLKLVVCVFVRQARDVAQFMPNVQYSGTNKHEMPMSLITIGDDCTNLESSTKRKIE